MLYTSSLFRWLQRKRYQYEVTFSLYMLTPTEKFIFSESILKLFPAIYSVSPCDSYQLPATINANTFPFADSFLFLFLSMVIIAASLYLPEHVSTIMRRAWFYWAGDETGSVKGSVGHFGSDSLGPGTRGGAGGGSGGDVLERLGSL